MEMVIQCDDTGRRRVFLRDGAGRVYPALGADSDESGINCSEDTPRGIDAVTRWRPAEEVRAALIDILRGASNV